MMKMKQSIKRMVLTGAAVTLMVSLAALAAMAQEELVRDHRDGSGEAGPIVRDHRDGSGGILCDIFSFTCDDPPPYNVSDPAAPPPVVNDPPDPAVDLVVAPPPKHCQVLPKGCKPSLRRQSCSRPW
jgi:hypothetical protein